MDNTPRIVCFTGHRDIPNAEYPVLNDVLERELERQISAGAGVFRTGGALGFDTLAALRVLSLRRKYPDIRLELFLPFPAQAREWKPNDALLYEQILDQADSRRYTGETYYPGILQARNRQLVSGADVCIAYLKSSHGGGTAYTCALALRGGLEWINLAENIETF